MPESAVLWTRMKDDAWIMLDAPGATSKPNVPDYLIVASARLALNGSDSPITDTEAVLIFYQP